MAHPQRPSSDGVAPATAQQTLGGVRTAVVAMRQAARAAEAGLEPERLAAIQADGRRAIADLHGLLGPLRAAPDRWRSARGLHDRCGDAIGVMAVQAGAAQAVRGHDRQRAREAVRTIQAASAEALTALDGLASILDGA